MEGLFIFGTVIGVLWLKAYLVDTIKQYYKDKEKDDYKQHILNMKL